MAPGENADAPSLQRLLQLLEEQRRFLQASCSFYDQGFEAEAKRIAVALRSLLHDYEPKGRGKPSRSLLWQLKVKGKLAFFDSAEEIQARNILSTPGLVVLYNPTGGWTEGKYYAPLDELPSFRVTKRSAFEHWWTSPVTRERSGGTWSRWEYVRVLANREGGAHVDPKLDRDYERLVHDNGMGIEFHGSDGVNLTPSQINIVLASVRQIAHELNKTLACPAYVYPQSE